MRTFWLRLARAISLLGVLAWPVGAIALDAHLIPADAFFRQKAMLDAQLSPSGRYVGVQMARGFKRASLLVFDLQSASAPKVPVAYGDVDVIDFNWISDERLIYRVGELDASAVGRYPSTFATDIDGKNKKALLCGDFGDCSGAAPFRSLYVPTSRSGGHGGEVIVGGLRGRTVEFRWLNTLTGELGNYFSPAMPSQVDSWWFDSHGTPVLAHSVHELDGKQVLHRFDPEARAWRPLISFPLHEMPFHILGVSDDGQIYITLPRGDAGESVLTTLDVSTGMPVQKTMVATPGFDFDGRLLRRIPGGDVIGFRTKAESAVTVWTAPDMKKLQTDIDDLLPGNVNDIDCRRCDGASAVALVHSYSDRDPGRFLLYRRQTGKLEELAAVRPDLKPDQMATVEFHRISARDGRSLPVWVTLPADAERGGNRPTIVLAHGGPWVRGREWKWDDMSQFLASRGYLVIEPEFRGSKGYGKSHLEAGIRQWGLGMQDDLSDALQWAKAEGLAGDRACIMGASYGGYAALMGLIKNPEQFNCGVAYAAISDLLLFLKGDAWQGDDDAVNIGRRQTLPEWVGLADRDVEQLLKVSPVAQAGRIHAPLLLAHGIFDRRATFAHGTRMRDALVKAGRSVRWIEYENEGHAWSTRTRIDFAKKLEIFLAEHLLGPTH